jgi:hypothetical protein
MSPETVPFTLTIYTQTPKRQFATAFNWQILRSPVQPMSRPERKPFWSSSPTGCKGTKWSFADAPYDRLLNIA